MAHSADNRLRRRQQRSQVTESQLLRCARAVFAANGYEAASLELILRDAGLTKGALYYHFENKRHLFEAVFESEQTRLAEMTEDVYLRESNPIDGLHAAFRCLLGAAQDPGIQRIALIDGPAVLGWDYARAIEDRHTVAYLRVGLQQAIDQGAIAPRPLEPIAQLLNGAIWQAAVTAARSNKPALVARQVLAELRLILEALAQSPKGKPAR